MTSASTIRIGELAKHFGANVQTIRYYERRGLLPKPRRSSGGYRLYDGDAIRRLDFIGKAQQLGFSLNEIGELLSLRMRPGTTCLEVRDKAHHKIVAVDEKIVELTRIRDALTKLAAACRGKGPASACPILEVLAASEERTQ